MAECAVAKRSAESRALLADLSANLVVRLRDDATSRPAAGDRSATLEVDAHANQSRG